MDSALLVWIACVLFVLACIAAAAAIHMQMQITTLQHRLMRAWQREADLRRELEIAKACTAQAKATYDRRVARWCEYATNLQDVAVALGTLAPWKAEADRKTMPFVESAAAPLD